MNVPDEAAVTALANDRYRCAPGLGGRPPVRRAGRRLERDLGDAFEAVDANVSIVAAYRGVRLAMGEQQRQIGQRGGVVMVGRDIGTMILPEAP